MQINFHRKTGIKPSIGATVERYGAGTVYILRMGWSALTLTVGVKG